MHRVISTSPPAVANEYGRTCCEGANLCGACAAAWLSHHRLTANRAQGDVLDIPTLNFDDRRVERDGPARPRQEAAPVANTLVGDALDIPTLDFSDRR